MQEISVKSTKQQILNAYMEAKEKLDMIDKMKDDPVIIAKKEDENRVIESANQVAGLNILSPEIVSKYKDLCKAIELKQAELKEYYEISERANSLVALINSHKELKMKLEEELKSLRETTLSKMEEEKDELKKSIDELDKSYIEKKKNLDKEYSDYFAKCKTDRKRNEEDYQYDIERKHKIENDLWEDEKNKREKELLNKEVLINEKLEELNKKVDYYNEIENKISKIPELISEATKKAKEECKDEISKIHAYEIKSINTKNAYELNSLNDRIDRLTSELSSKEDEIIYLQERLDNAYEQMKQLASDTVKSSGIVKILNSENNSK